jgi:hypothetical protein
VLFVHNDHEFVITAVPDGTDVSRGHLRRGVFQSGVDLQNAINRFVPEPNAESKPFTWTATPTKSSPPSNEVIKC